MLTNAEKQAAFRYRQLAKGRLKLQFWVDHLEYELLKEAILHLRKARKNACEMIKSPDYEEDENPQGDYDENFKDLCTLEGLMAKVNPEDYGEAWGKKKKAKKPKKTKNKEKIYSGSALISGKGIKA